MSIIEDMKKVAANSREDAKRVFRAPRSKGWQRKGDRYHAYLYVNYTKLYLGSYDTPEAATRARDLAHAEYEAVRILAMKAAIED